MASALTQKFLRLPLWVWILLGIIIAGVLVFVAVNQPRQASWRYGACRVFLEDSVRFPETIKTVVVSETASSASIGYSDINAYGSEQVKIFECYYSTAQNGRPVLSKITLDRNPLPDDTIATFNAMLPIILTQKLNTDLPRNFPSDLADFR